MYSNQGFGREQGKEAREVLALFDPEWVRGLYPRREGICDDSILLRTKERTRATQSE